MAPVIGYGVMYAFGASAAAGTVAFTVAGAAITWGTLVGQAVLLGASVAYSASQRSKMKNALRNLESNLRDQMTVDPIAPRRIVYGHLPVSGVVIFRAVETDIFHSSYTNGLLYSVMIVSARQCFEFGDVYFHDTELVKMDYDNFTVPQPRNDTVYVDKYAGYFWVVPMYGTPTQAASSFLTSATTDWTTDHRCRGCAGAVFRYGWSTDKYKTGQIPQTKIMVKGALVYDPRDPDQVIYDSSTWKYSANAALIVADFLRDRTCGKKIHHSRIVWDSVIEAANICDEPSYWTVGSDVYSEPRYEIHGTVESNSNPDEVLNSMCSAMMGEVIESGGFYHVRAGAYRTPSLDLNDTDLRGTLVWNPIQSKKETFNRVKGLYVSPANTWVVSDFPSVPNADFTASQDWETKDGEPLIKDTEYPFTTSERAVQRLAWMDLEQSRLEGTVSGTWSLKMMQAMPGDNVRLTRSQLGWTNKVFRVEKWSLREERNGDDSIALVVDAVLRETSSSAYL